MNNQIYESDGLGRSRFCNAIANMIYKGVTSQDGLFISINGPYGCGKTTCLGFIQQELLSKNDDKLIIVNYNAWENNFYENSIVTILYSLLEEIKNRDLSSIKETLKNSSKKVCKLLVGMGKRFVKDKTGLDFDDLNEESIFDDLKSFNENLLVIQSQLKEIISKGYKIVIIVDELDRCLPNKVINVLESLYRLLNIQGISTLLAIDREQIEQTILTIFGNATNTQGYLARFIDYEFEIPGDTQYTFLKSKARWLPDSVFEILNLFNFELREKIKIINEMVLNVNLDEDNDYANILYAILLCLKRKNEKLFKDLPRGPMRYQTEKIRLNNTKFYAFSEYLKAKKVFKKIYAGKDFQKYLLSLFDEMQYVDGKEIREYLNEPELDWENIRNKIVFNRSILGRLVNDVDVLYI